MAKRGGFITTGEQARSFLGWAFTIAFFAHLAIASVFPNINKHAKNSRPNK